MTAMPSHGDTVLVVGYGLHGRAVAAALLHRGVRVTLVDDRPGPAAHAHADELGLSIEAAPGEERLAELVDAATHVLPTPGLPDRHRVFDLSRRLDTPVIGEFDLAGQWDDRRIVAITGTNGKTTVTTMVTEMLQASGVAAVAAGNMELPLVTAIDDAGTELFVVEASSFRLGHASRFSPDVAAWLNFDPDHLDVHASLDVYEAAKARIWAALGPDATVVANADDAVVMRNVPQDATVMTFGIHEGDAHVADGRLVVAGAALMPVDELQRALPHDLSNALAAASIALAAGADRGAVAGVLRSFGGLQHRVELVADCGGVRWYNDSKATTPHAVIAGVGGFDSAVLIAGGRNKGVDLQALAPLADHLRGVVAIGEAADEVAAVFADLVPVRTAQSMADAIDAAGALAEPGDAVVLSPACTSYDWYANYGERGEDFTRLVRRHLKKATP